MIRYEASREVTLQGTVVSVNVATRGPGAFVSLGFSAGGQAYEVMVGPEALLKRREITFSAGDALTVVGVPSEGPQGSVFMARCITRGETLWTLLDKDGVPTGRP